MANSGKLILWTIALSFCIGGYGGYKLKNLHRQEDIEITRLYVSTLEAERDKAIRELKHFKDIYPTLVKADAGTMGIDEDTRQTLHLIAEAKETIERYNLKH